LPPVRGTPSGAVPADWRPGMGSASKSGPRSSARALAKRAPSNSIALELEVDVGDAGAAVEGGGLEGGVDEGRDVRVVVAAHVDLAGGLARRDVEAQPQPPRWRVELVGPRPVPHQLDPDVARVRACDAAEGEAHV